MPAKRPRGIASALLPFGIVALVAGCGGGSVVSRPGGGTTYIPPAGNGAPGPMVSAQLIVQIPARGSSSGKRRPNYYSPATQKLTLAYAASPNPLPSPTVFTVPTPGATPTSFPISVQVPVGTETFQVNTYDGSTYPGPASPNGYLLSTAQVNQTINPNGAQSITIVGQGVPYRFQFTPSFSTVLQNQAGDQSVPITVAAYDYDNDQITGPIAGTLTLSQSTGPAGAITVSPASFTSMPASATASYNHGNKAFARLSTVYAGPTSYGGLSNASFGMNPTSYLWVANKSSGTVSILDAHSGATMATVDVNAAAGISDPQYLAVQSSMNGCPGAATAFVAGSTRGAFITMPTPGPSPMASPMVVSAGTPQSVAMHSTGITSVAFDASCVAYFGTGYMGGSGGGASVDVYQVGEGALLSSGTAIITSASPGPLSDYGNVDSIVANGGNVYAAEDNTSVAMWNGSVATNLGVAAYATALAPYGANGFAAVFPTPNPSPSAPNLTAFAVYPGGGPLGTPVTINASGDVINSLVPDGNGGYWAATAGGAYVYSWLSPLTSVSQNASAGNYGLAMWPNGAVPTAMWVLNDGTPGSVTGHYVSGFSTLSTYSVGNSPRAIGVGP